MKIKNLLTPLIAYPIALIAHLCIVILFKLDCIYISVWRNSKVKTYDVNAVFRNRPTKGQLDISVVTDNSVELCKNGTPIYFNSRG